MKACLVGSPWGHHAPRKPEPCEAPGWAEREQLVTADTARTAAAPRSAEMRTRFRPSWQHFEFPRELLPSLFADHYPMEGAFGIFEFGGRDHNATSRCFAINRSNSSGNCEGKGNLVRP